MAGNFTDIEDILDANPEDISSRTGMQLEQVDDLLLLIAVSLGPSPVVLSSLSVGGSQYVLSTGDAGIDHILGGGIHTGMIWELAGERYMQKPS
jgi:DNA repair protein RAD57